MSAAIESKALSELRETGNETSCVADIMKYSTAERPIYEDVLHEVYQALTRENPIEAFRSLLSEVEARIPSKEEAELIKTKQSKGKQWHAYDLDVMNKDNRRNFYALHALFMSARLDQYDIMYKLSMMDTDPGEYPFYHMAMEFSSENYVLTAINVFPRITQISNRWFVMYPKNSSINFTPVTWAARCGRKDLLQRFVTLFTKGMINVSSESGHDSFLAAIIGGDLPTVKYVYELEDYSVDKIYENARGWNAFMWAAAAGSIPVLEYLADLNCLDWEYETPDGFNLFMAAVQGVGNFSLYDLKEGNEALLNLLKKLGDDLYFKTCKNGDNAFMAGVRGNNIGNLKFLLSLDKEFYKKVNAEGCNAFLLSDKDISVETLQFLQSLDSSLIHSVDNNNENVLHKAARSGNRERFVYLANQGIKIGQLSNQGKNERAIAQECGNANIVSLLDEITSAFNFYQNTSSQRSMESNGSNFSINCRDKAGKSLLHYVFSSEKTEFRVRRAWALELIKKGIKRDIVDDTGKTYLSEKCAKWDPHVFIVAHKLLIDQINKDQGLSQDEKQAKKDSLGKEFSDIFEQVLDQRYRLMSDIGMSQKFQIDFDYLADNFGKKYWLHFARFVSQHTVGSDDADYQKHVEPLRLKCINKLYDLIYTGALVCKELGNDEVEFKLGKGYVDSNEDPITREVRLRNAFIYAQSANDVQKMLMLHMEIATPGKSVDEMHKIIGNTKGMSMQKLIIRAFTGLLGTLHTKGQKIRCSAPNAEAKREKEEGTIQGLDVEDAESVETAEAQQISAGDSKSQSEESEMEASGSSSLSSLLSLSLTPTSADSVSKGKEKAPAKILQFSQGGQAAPAGLGLQAYQEEEPAGEDDAPSLAATPSSEDAVREHALR